MKVYGKWSQNENFPFFSPEIWGRCFESVSDANNSTRTLYSSRGMQKDATVWFLGSKRKDGYFSVDLIAHWYAQRRCLQTSALPRDLVILAPF